MSFPRLLHNCYEATDPRINHNLSQSLRDQNIVIVGAGRGVGRACAEFATYAGAKRLVCLALEQLEVDETLEICQNLNPELQGLALVVDNTDYDAVEQVVKKIEHEFGPVDVLLMNAGRPPQFVSVAESDPKIWWETVAVSLQGAFNFARAILPGMQRQKKGRIIFTSSSGAHTNQGMASYVVAKLGQVRLAEILHVENREKYNIKCFAMNPGAIRTRFFTDFEDVVQGRTLRNKSYVTDHSEADLKSAQNGYELLKNLHYDHPYMPAGLFLALAAGKLDFMSGRYLDAAVDIQRYIEMEQQIEEEDLCAVRLNLGNGELLPQLNRI